MNVASGMCFGPAKERACELLEGAGAHRNGVVGDVRHRLAGRLPHPSGQLRTVSQCRDRDVVGQVNGRAWATVEHQPQPAVSFHDGKAMKLREGDPSGVILVAPSHEL